MYGTVHSVLLGNTPLGEKEIDREKRHQSTLTALRSAELFSTLSDELLKKIGGLALTRRLEPGQILYSEYEEATALYVVVAGELRSIRQSADGREQVLSTERSGAVLAAVPVFNGGKFYSTMVADTPSEVASIEKHYVHQLCREHTELLWNLARVLGHRVRRYAELIESLALRTVEQRVAEYLFNVAHERGVRVGEGCLVELTLTQAEIATRIGSTREGISRMFAQLQKSGLIQMTGRRLIRIPSMIALSTRAGIRSEESAESKFKFSSEMA